MHVCLHIYLTSEGSVHELLSLGTCMLKARLYLGNERNAAALTDVWKLVQGLVTYFMPVGQ